MYPENKQFCVYLWNKGYVCIEYTYQKLYLNIFLYSKNP